MTLTRYCLFLLVAVLSHPLAWAEDRWVEGQHYQTLNPPVAVPGLFHLLHGVGCPRNELLLLHMIHLA